MVYQSRGPAKEKKKVEYIKDYSDFKVLFKMTKTRSPKTVQFCHESDDFLIHIVEFKTKSGIVSETHVIIRPDIEQWTRTYEREGFKKE